jgi:hypothetical protein
MIRTLVKSTKRILLNLEQYMHLLHWDRTNARVTSNFNNEVHLLIAKNQVYAKIAMICILSFLHHNPKAKIVLHCDDLTYPVMGELVSSRKRKGHITVVSDLDANVTWQYSKLKLILSLSGSHNVFMDADLRWNGTLTAPKNLTFFVAEFPIFQKSPFRQALHQLSFTLNDDTFMKNTSFIGFAGIRVSDKDMSQVFDLYHKFEDSLLKADIGNLDLQPLLRLSEQVILSVCSEKWATEIAYLKIRDGHKDGAFVESSYFGATGSMF